MNTIDLEVQGMSCGSCVRHVTEALRPLPGVSGVEVDLQTGRVRVSGEFLQGGASFASTLTTTGYPAKLTTSSEPLMPQSKTSGCCGGKGGCCS